MENHLFEIPLFVEPWLLAWLIAEASGEISVVAGPTQVFYGPHDKVPKSHGAVEADTGKGKPTENATRGRGLGRELRERKSKRSKSS